MVRLIIVAIVLTTGSAWGHGGRLDKSGCHHDRKRGGYHCHGGGGSSSSGGGGRSSLTPIKPLKLTEASVPIGTTSGELVSLYPDILWNPGPEHQYGLPAAPTSDLLFTCYRFTNSNLSMVVSVLRPRSTPEDTYEYAKNHLFKSLGKPAEIDGRPQGKGRLSAWEVDLMGFFLVEIPQKEGHPSVQFVEAQSTFLASSEGGQMLKWSTACITDRSKPLTKPIPKPAVEPASPQQEQKAEAQEAEEQEAEEQEAEEQAAQQQETEAQETEPPVPQKQSPQQKSEPTTVEL